MIHSWKVLFFFNFSAYLFCTFSVPVTGSPDPYRALGVSRSASAAELKQAYKRLALLHHPDKNGGSSKKFIEVQDAYEIVSNPEKRRAYEQEARYGSQQHQQHHQQQRWQQQQHEQHQRSTQYEHLLPSQTITLTNNNFRHLVHHSPLSWIVLIYSEDSRPCREASPTWEAAWRSMGQQQDVGMGRAHWRHQAALAQWLSKGSNIMGTPASYESLPMVVGIRRGCYEHDCVKRMAGPLTLTLLQEFVADKLLDLPRVPSLLLSNLPMFLQRASHLKVLGFAFAKTEGSGSLHLRRLAVNQKRMMVIVRVVYQETEVKLWQSQLNASAPITASSLVLVRGPGVSADVMNIKSSTSGGIEKQVLEAGFSWQYVPPLRLFTSTAMGCLWGREASKSRHTLSEMCVVAMGPAGPELTLARRNLVRLVHRFTATDAPSNPALGPAATAFMASRWRISWMDTTSQPEICSFHFPQLSSRHSDSIHSKVCGSPWWSRLWQATYAYALLFPSKLNSLSGNSRSGSGGSAVHVMVFQPVGERRGGFGRLAPGVYKFAVNTDVDLSSQNLTEADLAKLAGWISTAYSKPVSIMQAAGEFPPLLVDDEVLGAIDFLVERSTVVVRLILGGLLDVVFGNSENPLQQYLTVLVAIIAVVVMHIVWKGLQGPAEGEGEDARHPQDPQHASGERSQQQRQQQTTQDDSIRRNARETEGTTRGAEMTGKHPTASRAGSNNRCSLDGGAASGGFAGVGGSGSGPINYYD